VVLPQGWARVPLRAGTREALDREVFRRVDRLPAQVPRDQGMAYRAHVRRTVERMVRDARRAGGLDLYVPVRAARPLPASFVVAEIPHGLDAEPEAALARYAAGYRPGPGEGTPGELRSVGDGLAVRWEYVGRAADGEDAAGPGAGTGAPASRRVEYVLPVPEDPGRWLAVSHATPGDGDLGSPYTQALTDLFDAVMTTFRWTY
jgi:hypothetical protein